MGAFEWIGSFAFCMEILMRVLKILTLFVASSLPMTGTVWADVAKITVTGEGSMQAAPDMATVTLGVTSNAATASEAMSANSKASATVIARLKAVGIASEDLQTSNLSLNPNWSNSSLSGASEVSSYVASNFLTVRVRDLPTLGGVLDAAITDGANTLNGVSFGIMEPRPLQDEARKAAVMDARARAELLAEAAGGKLGPVIEMSEQQVFDAQPAMYRSDKMAGAVPVEAGQMDIKAAVTITFEMQQ